MCDRVCVCVCVCVSVKHLFHCSLMFDRWGVAGAASCIFKGKVTQAFCVLCSAFSWPTLNFATTAAAAENQKSTPTTEVNNIFTPLKHKSSFLYHRKEKVTYNNSSKQEINLWTQYSL